MPLVSVNQKKEYDIRRDEAMAELRSDLKFEITREIGVLGEGTKGWKKEVNLVSWNDRPVKLDIRDWNETHEKMGRGITLSIEETKKLLELLVNTEFVDDDNIAV